MGLDRNVVVDPQQPAVTADDEWPERRRHIAAVHQLLPVATGAKQQVIEAEERRGRAVNVASRATINGGRSAISERAMAEIAVLFPG